MKEKFQQILDNYNEITAKLSDPQVIGDQEKYRGFAKRHADLGPLVAKITEFMSTDASIREARDMLKGEADAEMEHWLHDELTELGKRKEKLEEELRFLMLPKDPNDDKNVIVEIRGGAGGQEAQLFAADLFRMYTRFAERQNWKPSVLSTSPSELGGLKEVIFEIKGRAAYSRLKFESGVHRVQRIPVTESGGRIHTSTVTVAVLPEADDIVEVDIPPQDLRIDIFRSSGPGGQSVNTTDSAVRVTHLPTGMVISMQDERSQLQNKERALRVLRAKLYEKMVEEQQSEMASARRLQVGTGDRSERIRTYNFPQGRVTDHRIGLTVHNLDGVLDGDITQLLDGLAAADRADKLEQVV
ncbi:MAG: peptide chain release factor 1 [Actinomycetota bacterium]|nr:peptide chain release factor 1 [Actinomycetota bacterium]